MGDVFAALAATWPPERSWPLGRVTCRAAPGGGSRVNACSGPDDLTEPELAPHPLWRVAPDQAALDARLAGLGYQRADPTLLRCGAGPATGPAVAHWPPTKAQRAVWAAGGIGRARLSVMDRVTGPKAALSVTPFGVGFVALHQGITWLHALEIRADSRGRGEATRLMAGVAGWAARHGTGQIALLVTAANAPANALYDRLGFDDRPGYHYRMRALGTGDAAR